MPVTQPRREEGIIDIFLSAYENNSWEDAEFTHPERTQDNGVDVLATRKSDGLKLAIEHTIIQPFLGEKGDFAQFWSAFEALQKDESFKVADRITYIFVPAGILDGWKQNSRQAIVSGISGWLKSNIAQLPEGTSKHLCKIDIPVKAGRTEKLDVILNAKVHLTANYTAFKIARQQVDVNLDKVVEKALRKKLAKLVNAQAQRRILMLEREHMNCTPEQILAELEKLRPAFPDFAKVDELWMVETLGYDAEGILYFFKYDVQGNTTAELEFSKGKVNTRWDHTMPYGLTE
jgi:hypothetical protein